MFKNYLKVRGNYKRDRYSFIRLGVVVVLTVGLFCLSFGDFGAVESKNITTGIKAVNSGIFNLVRGVLSLMLFATIFWELIQGYIQKQLASKWMTIIGAALFLIGVNAAPYAYALIMGGNAQSDVIGSGGEDFMKVK
jgi:hypothetical protein